MKSRINVFLPLKRPTKIVYNLYLTLAGSNWLSVDMDKKQFGILNNIIFVE